MSYPIFVAELCMEPLTVERLQILWDKTNIKNKCTIIDRLSKALFAILQKESPIPPAKTEKLCKNFWNKWIKMHIKTIIPNLSDMPPIKDSKYNNYKLHAPTGFIIESQIDDKSTKYIVHGILSSGKVYQLQLSHLSTCISSGWYFHSNDERISSVYKL